MPNNMFALNRRTFLHGLVSTGILLPSTGFSAMQAVNHITLRYPEGNKILNQVLKNTDYWSKASINKYNNKKYRNTQNPLNIRK